MDILVVNPPHESIGSRLAGEHLPPLGLLCVAGPLIDAGHRVRLLDADYRNLPLDRIAADVLSAKPDLLLLGHSGSTSAQPIVEDLARRVRRHGDAPVLVLGGVFPTYHWQEILRDHPAIDYIVRGEGEATTLALVTALAEGRPPRDVPGLAFRADGEPFATPDAPVIDDLDRHRVAWELTDGYDYTYWGGRKAVVVQFSRGCPYPCVYCGQSRFWRRWRHRDPQRFGDELERLHRERGVEVFNFADESMASDRDAWRAFLEALVAKDLGLVLVGSIRADHIVRDADLLPLYKKAGFERFLLGIENYDASVLAAIRKDGAPDKDREAIRLLREHGILSMATYVVGFGDERLRDYWRNLRQLLRYDPDQIQLVFATPHRWTPYFEENRDRTLVLADQRQWDYKHQVLANPHLPPWAVYLCVKAIEVAMQARPKAVRRLLFHRDPALRRAMRWYTRIGRRVWFRELFAFFFAGRRTRRGGRLGDFWA